MTRNSWAGEPQILNSIKKWSQNGASSCNESRAKDDTVMSRPRDSRRSEIVASARQSQKRNISVDRADGGSSRQSDVQSTDGEGPRLLLCRLAHHLHECTCCDLNKSCKIAGACLIL